LKERKYPLIFDIDTEEMSDQVQV